MTDRSLPDRVMVAVRKSGATLTQDEVWAKVREAQSLGLTAHEDIAGFVLEEPGKRATKRSAPAASQAARPSR